MASQVLLGAPYSSSPAPPLKHGNLVPLRNAVNLSSSAPALILRSSSFRYAARCTASYSTSSNSDDGGDYASSTGYGENAAFGAPRYLNNSTNSRADYGWKKDTNDSPKKSGSPFSGSSYPEQPSSYNPNEPSNGSYGRSNYSDSNAGFRGYTSANANTARPFKSQSDFPKGRLPGRGAAKVPVSDFKLPDGTTKWASVDEMRRHYFPDADHEPPPKRNYKSPDPKAGDFVLPDGSRKWNSVDEMRRHYFPNEDFSTPPKRTYKVPDPKAGGFVLPDGSRKWRSVDEMREHYFPGEGFTSSRKPYAGP